MRACGACWGLSVAVRNGCHMSITAKRICRLFSGPSQRKNSSILPSERSLPPNQMGRLRSRSLTKTALRVPRSDRDLVYANHLRGRLPRTPQLLGHVLLVEGLDRFPIEVEFLSHVLDCRGSATPAHGQREALRVAR